MTDALLLHGVRIYIRHDLPPVEALGIGGGRVLAAGPLEQVRRALPPGYRTQLLLSGTLIPAFVDAHQHAYLVAADPHTDVLYRKARDIRSLLAVLETLIAAESKGPSRPWLRFHGYQPSRLAEWRSPTAAELDRVAPDRPLHVISRTFHESAVNSAGLDALQIGRTTPDPDGGRIVRDRRGRPTGVLLEAASFTAEAQSRGREHPNAWRERLEAHGRLLLSLGITRIGDAAVPAVVAAEMVSAMAAVGVDAHPLLVGARIDEPAMVEGCTAKVLVDGGEYCHLCMTGRQLGILTMAAFKAYFGREGKTARAVGQRAGSPKKGSDGRWHTGITYPGEAGMGAMLRRAASTGAKLAVHAVGNGSVEAVLRALAADPALANAVPIRVEHAIATDPELARRLGDANIPVVAQPIFLTAFGHELNLVPVPAPLRLMPFRTQLEAGVPLVFSSDYPAAELNPWQGVSAAVTRLDEVGCPIHPEEAIELPKALDAYTRSGAKTLGIADAGSLEPGMRADIVWCDRDPHAIAPTQLAEIATLATWFEGRLVHTAASAKGALGALSA